MSSAHQLIRDGYCPISSLILNWMKRFPLSLLLHRANVWSETCADVIFITIIGRSLNKSKWFQLYTTEFSPLPHSPTPLTLHERRSVCCTIDIWNALHWTCTTADNPKERRPLNFLVRDFPYGFLNTDFRTCEPWIVVYRTDMHATAI